MDGNVIDLGEARKSAEQTLHLIEVVVSADGTTRIGLADVDTENVPETDLAAALVMIDQAAKLLGWTE